LIAGATVVPLSACGQHGNDTYAYAKHLFETHRSQLEQLVKLIRDCKYARQIDSSLDSNNPNFNVCSNHSEEYRNRIAQKLAKLNILWVTVNWVGPWGSSNV